MFMPKSRELQVKIPSPKAIFIGFLPVTVKVLNSYVIMKLFSSHCEDTEQLRYNK